MKKITLNEFIERAIIIHNNKYNYEKTIYKNSYTKIIIICPIHGEFEQTPKMHLIGQGCRKCFNEVVGNNTRKSTSEFINESLKIHGSKYDYSLVNYKRRNIKVKIICPIHGEFEQTPATHLNGTNCLKCGRILNAKNRRKTTDYFINKALKIHGSKYDYSLVNYIKAKQKVKIICPIHGEFEQVAMTHLNGSGCSICCISKGENKIMEFLINNNIDFEQQKIFNDCIGIKRNLPFDFYLPKYNLVIEYDGIQHFIEQEFFGGIKQLKIQLENDRIKNSYCLEKKINIIRISYLEFNNLDNKLMEQLCLI